MDHKLIASSMASNAKRIHALLQCVSLEQARWRPDPESWSLLEVINHLYDEEREDFRVRLSIILSDPEQPWPPIDPGGWVTERRYNERDPERSLQGFLDERQASLEWLNGLESPNWEAVCETPFGTMRAGDMLASWATHDLLHMRQLVELHYAIVLDSVKPYEVDYAGSW